MPHETAGPTGNGNARPDSPLPETQGGETPTEYHKKRKALKAIVTGKTCRRRIRIGQSHENRTVRQARKSRTQRRFYSSGRLGGRKSEQDGRKLRREPCRFAGVAICRSQRMSPLSSVRRKYDVCQRQRNQQRSQQPGPAALRTAFDDRLKHGPVAVQAVEAGYVAAIPFPQNDPLLEQHQAGSGPGSSS